MLLPLQHTSLQKRCITVAVHCNVAVWLQVALQYYCNIVETLPWNIAMDTFVQYSWNIVHTLPCNIAMATFVQRFGNIAHTLPCNIAISETFRDHCCNISETFRDHCWKIPESFRDHCCKIPKQCFRNISRNVAQGRT